MEQHRVRYLQADPARSHRHRRQRQSGPSDPEMERRVRRGQVRGVPRPQLERRLHQVQHRHRHQLHQHQLHRKRQHLLLQGPRSGRQRHGRCVEQHCVRDLQADSVRSHRYRRQRCAGPSHADMEGRHRRGQVRGVPRPQHERRLRQVFHCHRHVLHQHILYRGRQYVLLQGPRPEIRRHGRCVEQHRVRDLQADPVRPQRHRRQRCAGPSYPEMESRHRRGQVRGVPRPQQGR